MSRLRNPHQIHQARAAINFLLPKLPEIRREFKFFKPGGAVAKNPRSQ